MEVVHPKHDLTFDRKPFAPKNKPSFSSNFNENFRYGTLNQESNLTVGVGTIMK